MKRLLRAPSANTSTRASPEKVLLFVRLEGENYCCLGRVRWVAADVLCSPVKLKWELTDFDAFSETPHFQKILRQGGC